VGQQVALCRIPGADLFGLVPLVGDAFDPGYYEAQGGLDCAAGRCDPWPWS